MDPNKFLTVAQTAAVLGISKQTVRNYIKRKRIYGRKLAGRFFVKAESIKDFEKPRLGRPKK